MRKSHQDRHNKPFPRALPSRLKAGHSCLADFCFRKFSNSPTGLFTERPNIFPSIQHCIILYLSILKKNKNLLLSTDLNKTLLSRECLGSFQDRFGRFPLCTLPPPAGMGNYQQHICSYFTACALMNEESCKYITLPKHLL